MLLALARLASPVSAQTAAGPITKAYLMSFHACNSASGRDCANPLNHGVFLAESDDGSAWSIVTDWSTYPGSVPDVIRRGNTIYVYSVTGVALQVQRFDTVTNVLHDPVTVTLTDGGAAEYAVDPSLFVDDQGRLVLFYLQGSASGSPGACDTGSTKLIRSATEVTGSDGAEFTVDLGNRASITLDCSRVDSASDPDVFFDGTNYVMYVSRGSTLQVYTAATLQGAYTLSPDLTDGYLTTGTSGGVSAGLFDTTTSPGLYWTYAHAGSPAVIRRATHPDLLSQLADADFTDVVTPGSLGVAASVELSSPGLALNEPGTRFRFSTTVSAVPESKPLATITVVRLGWADSPQTVDYTTSNGTAKAGDDYVATSGTLIFATGQRSATFTVTILDDTVVEGDETVILTLGNPSGGATIDTSTATLTIGDNDQGGAIAFATPGQAVVESTGRVMVAVVRSGGLASGVTVDYTTGDDTATAGIDYVAAAGTLTFAAGELVKWIPIDLLDNTVVDVARSFVVTLSNAGGGAVLGSPLESRIGITDDDRGGTIAFLPATYSVAENAGTVTLTVVRTGGSASGVTVYYETASGTATTGSDFSPAVGTLTFAAGQTSATLSVGIVDDTVVEPPKTFTVTLSNPQGGATLGASTTASVAIVDDDAVFTFSARIYRVREGGVATVTVRRLGSTAKEMTVDFATTDGTATAPADYADATQTLTFGVGVSSVTVAVTTVADAWVEPPPQDVNLSLSNPSGGATLGRRSNAVLRIQRP